MLGDWDIGMFFCSVSKIGCGPRRGKWVALQVHASSFFSPSLHPCLVLPCLVVLTAASPYFMPLNAYGGTGLQRAPFTCQSQGDGNGGAEKSRVCLDKWPSQSTLCGPGLVWTWTSFWVVNVQVCICWALW